jgi:uncharacterized membrane protein YbhN (UPF0104 family)
VLRQAPAPTGPAGDLSDRLEDATVDEARRLRRGLVSLLLLGVLVAVLVLAVPGLRDVARRLEDVNPAWIALAVALEVASCAGYVLAFQHVFYRAPMRLAARVAFSEMAFSAAVPLGGAGGIAVGAWVAKAKGGSLRRFMERSAVLFVLTTAVNAGTLAIAGVLVAVGVVHSEHPVLLGLAPAAFAIAGIGLALCLPPLSRRLPAAGERSRAARWLGASAAVVDAVRRELLHPTWRLAGAVAYLWFDIAVLWASFSAFGAAPPVVALTAAFILGYLANVAPIPGGIGALDAGLTGALVLYGVDATSAAAAVVVYHTIVLWIPTLLGSIAFVQLRRTLDEPVRLRPERPPSG